LGNKKFGDNGQCTSDKFRTLLHKKLLFVHYLDLNNLLSESQQVK